MRIVNRKIVCFGALALAFVSLSYLSLSLGSADIRLLEVGLPTTPYASMESQIFWEVRFPRLLAAVLSGAALAVSGLSLQTLFRNPLAGPFVLGISSGASLGVALSLLAGFSFGHFGVLGSAAVGAMVVTAAVLWVSARFRSASVLLIAGLMFGYLMDAVVSLLIASSEAEALRVYVAWGMGSFGRLTFDGVGLFALTVVLGFLLVAISVKYLNSSRLGDDFARGLGVNVRLHRTLVLLGASVLAAASTAFCGPVAFVGIAVPHLAYMLFKTSNHRVLIPGAALCGMVICVVASMFGKVPLNAVLSFVGVPVVLWVVLRGRGGRL